MKKSKFIFIFMVMLLASCERVEVFNEAPSYMQYAQKLNLTTTFRHHTLLYKASLVPTEMIGINNGAPLDSIEAWYSNNIEIALEITDTTTHRDLLDLYSPDAPEYGQILNFYSVGIKEYVRLVADADTFFPVYANPVRTYGVLKNNPIVLGFALNQPVRDYKRLQLYYFDALFYKEHLVIDFSDSDFHKTPKLVK